MTDQAFRRMALSWSGVVEGSHMGHADFRVHGKIFATIHSSDRAMVKLTPDQQAAVVAEYPEAFVPESGAWGRQGCTRVYLEAADAEAVGEAMTLAWRQTSSAASKPRATARRPRR